MSTSVTMPQLGESVTEGTITRWLKQVGDTVAVDEPLLEISTDKVDTEIPSPAAGVLTEIHANEDDTVEIGGQLATIGGGDGDGESAAAAPAAEEAAPAQQAAPPTAPPAPPTTPAAPPTTPAAPPAAPAPAAAATPPPAAPAPKVTPAATAAPATDEAAAANGSAYVTPLVRKLAGEHSIDLSAVTGSGVGGRIRKQDIVEAAAVQKEQAQKAATQSQDAPQGRPATADANPARGRTEKLSRLRTLIGRRMVESLQTTAQLTSVVEVDVSKIARMRAEAKADFQARNGVKLSFLPFFAIAAIEALAEHPKLNSSVDSEAGTITYHDGAHLGMAVDTERGLVVPVIRNAGDLNLTGVAKKIGDLAERARGNKLAPDELAGGTFTLTNTGSRGALFDTPILNQPQVAILGTGSVVKRAVVVDDDDLGELILPRSMVYLSLTYDHRVVDGADAARYLVSVKDRLETAAFDVELGLS